MTSDTREKLSSRVLTHHSNEAAAGNISLQRYPLLTHFDQEEQVSSSGITDKKPQAPFFKYDLEIPPQAQIVSVSLSSLPVKIQQLMLARAKDVSDVRQATEITNVTYVWPVLKMKDPSKSFLAVFPKSLKLTSPSIAKHSSGGVQSAQISPVKQHIQEEQLKTRSCPLIVKSSNSIVSVVLKSLTKNKDLTNILPLSSLSPVANQDKIDIPLFKENALVIHNGRVYLLYVTRDEAVSSGTEIHTRDTLLRRTTVHLITCRAIHDITSKVPHPLLSRKRLYFMKQNIKCPTSLPHQQETLNAALLSPHGMTATSQPKGCSPSGNEQQFLKQTVSPPEEDLQKRCGKEARQEEDKELRKKFGIVKDVRICLKRINATVLTEDSGKSPAFKWNVTARTEKSKNMSKQTLELGPVWAKKRKVNKTMGIILKQKKEEHSTQILRDAAETMKN